MEGGAPEGRGTAIISNPKPLQSFRLKGITQTEVLQHSLRYTRESRRVANVFEDRAASLPPSRVAAPADPRSSSKVRSTVRGKQSPTGTVPLGGGPIRCE